MVPLIRNLHPSKILYLIEQRNLNLEQKTTTGYLTKSNQKITVTQKNVGLALITALYSHFGSSWVSTDHNSLGLQNLTRTLMNRAHSRPLIKPGRQALCLWRNPTTVKTFKGLCSPSMLPHLLQAMLNSPLACWALAFICAWGLGDALHS